MKNQPVKIVIDDVYILARARPQGKVDLEEDARIEQATKQEKLKSAEAVDNAASQVGAVAGDEGTSAMSLKAGYTDRPGKQSYMGAIVSKVVDNVQIHVKNIHMRYEDGSSTPEVSYLWPILGGRAHEIAPLRCWTYDIGVQGCFNRRQLGRSVHSK